MKPERMKDKDATQGIGVAETRGSAAKPSSLLRVAPSPCGSFLCRSFALFLVLLSLGSSVNVPGRGQQRRNVAAQEQSSKTAPAPRRAKGNPVVTNNEGKELAAGNHSSVLESFVLIARDAETYALLLALNNSLPVQSADFFKSHAVIAAFLGQRRTSGFSLDIKRDQDGSLRIREHAPAKGAMVKMVLSTPFKVVAIAVETDQPIMLALDETWQNRLRPYRLTSGELTINGGFAGVRERLRLEGTVGVMRAGALATFWFDLQSAGGAQKRHLRDVASGNVGTSGEVRLNRLEAFALTGAIQSPFHATGRFTHEEQYLALNLETTRARHVADNFTAKAAFKALATTPPAAKQAITGDEPQ